eukprot:3910163-Karenia_brevis.AAC.1
MMPIRECQPAESSPFSNWLLEIFSSRMLTRGGLAPSSGSVPRKVFFKNANPRKPIGEMASSS